MLHTLHGFMFSSVDCAALSQNVSSKKSHDFFFFFFFFFSTVFQKRMLPKFKFNIPFYVNIDCTGFVTKWFWLVGMRKVRDVRWRNSILIGEWLSLFTFFWRSGARNFFFEIWYLMFLTLLLKELIVYWRWYFSNQIKVQ